MKAKDRESIVYSYIYDLSKSQYQKEKLKRKLRLVIKLTTYIFISSCIILVFAYFIYIKPNIQTLKNMLTQYKEKLEQANREIEIIKTENKEYQTKLKNLEKIFNNLEIVDNRIVDLNLSEKVEENIKLIDKIDVKYQNFSRGDKNVKETALTFDLGTGEELPFVYRTLKRFRVNATIFVSNENPSITCGSLFNERNIKYLKKLSKIGCEFGNHTWSHYNLVRSLYESSKRRRLLLTPLSDDVIDLLTLRTEFKKVEETLLRETGIQIKHIWRAPYGAINERILKLAAASGYRYHIFWSSNRLGPLDFYDYVFRKIIYMRDDKTNKLKLEKNPYYFSSSELFNRLKEWEKVDPYGLNGAIAIAHLGTARKFDRTISILPEYIAYFKNKGYRFVKVTQMLPNL